LLSLFASFSKIRPSPLPSSTITCEDSDEQSDCTIVSNA
jgi:hypothetical protein